MRSAQKEAHMKMPQPRGGGTAKELHISDKSEIPSSTTTTEKRRWHTRPPTSDPNAWPTWCKTCRTGTSSVGAAKGKKGTWTI